MSSDSLSQAEIEALMAQAAGGDAGAATPPAASSADAVAAGIGDLQKVANAAAAGLDEKFQSAPAAKSAPVVSQSPVASSTPAAQPKTIGAAIPGTGSPHGFPTPTMAPNGKKPPPGALELLDDVELDVRIELGRTQMYIEDVLRLGVDSVVELDKLAGDPVDIYVNERLIARGEVLVLNDNFCVRINDILSPVPELAGDA